MKIEQNGSRTKLIAEEGMVLTDGKTYGRVVFLPDGADASSYTEITDADLKEILYKEDSLL